MNKHLDSGKEKVNLTGRNLWPNRSPELGVRGGRRTIKMAGCWATGICRWMDFVF